MLDTLIQSPKGTKMPRRSVFDSTLRKGQAGTNGFHAKKNSQIGASRARSIGNRNTKPTKKK